MAETKAKNRSQIHEIYGQKKNIVIILSDFLQIGASTGKKDKDTRNGFKTTVCSLLLFPFNSKTEGKSKKASDHYLGKAVIKLVIKYAFFLPMRTG